VSPRARIPIEAPGEPTGILLASADPRDHILLPEVLNHPHWQWQRSQSCRQTLALLRSHQVAVLLCERDQPDGCWLDLLDAAKNLTTPPSLVVCSRLADEHLWAEVLNLGGYDVLVKPFDREEVLRVAFLAWHSWKRRSGAVERPSVLVERSFSAA
jgi:DNA-binding response OmpR family regulator